MRKQISQNDFEQLKFFFDQNDGYNGATFLEKLLEEYLEDSYKQNYNGEVLYHVPFECGEGLSMTHDPGNTYDKPKLCIDNYGFSPELNEKIMETLKLGEQLIESNERLRRLEKMHTNDGDHIPPIISTKEQYDEMKDSVDKERKVLVETTFDKAMKVL